MAQALTGKTIADTYIYLVRVNADDSTLGEYNAAPYSLSTGVGDPYPIFFNKERILIGLSAAVPNASLDVRPGGNSLGDIECVKLRVAETGNIGTVSDADLLKLSTNLLTVTGEVTTTSNVNVGGNLVVTGESTFNGVINLGDTVADTLDISALIESNLIPTGVRNLGSDANQWNDLYITGTANIDSLVADTANIDGGNIDGTTIGGASPAAGTFTGITATTADINGGTIDGTIIGGSTPAAGSFNGLTITGSTTFPTDSISGEAIHGGSISNISNYAGTDATLTGTLAAADLQVDTSVLAVNLALYNDRVGINTVTPTDQLEVSTPSGNAYIAVDSALNGEAGVKLVENNVTKWQIYNDGDSSVSDDLLIKDDGDVRMTLTQLGRVGIGVASPTDEKLEVGGAIVVGDAEASAGATADGAIKYASGDFMGRKAGSWVTLTAVPGTSSAAGWSLHGSNYVYLTTGGDQVSIGGGAPTDGAVKLDVDGTIRGEGWHANTQMDFTSGDNDPGLHGLVPAPTQANYDDGKFLKADGTWADPGAGTIGAVGDVTITSATDGDMLVWSGSAWVDLTPSITTAGTASYVSGNAAATLSYAAASATYTITPMAMPSRADFDLDHMKILIGAAADNSENLGAFTGTVLASSTYTVKSAIQALGTQVDLNLDGSTAHFTANVLVEKQAALAGTHTAGDHATIMTDSAASFVTDALIGGTIYNVTDGSSGYITDNDGTTVTAVLTGGSDNSWDTADNDVYRISTTSADLEIRGNLSVRLPDATSGYQTVGITGASQANPCVITVGAGGGGHPFATGDRININGVVGMTELNAIGTTTITYIDATNFSLDGVNSAGFTSYDSGGKAEAVRIIQSNLHGLEVGDAVGLPVGTAGAEQIFTVEAVGSANEFTIDSDPITLPAADADFGQGYKDSDLFLVQNGDNTTNFVIDASGKVGIGTTAPAYLLDAAGAGAQSMRIYSSDNNANLIVAARGEETAISNILFSANTTTKGSIVYNHNTTDTNQNMRFIVGDNNTTAMAIEGDGKIGIGTVSPVVNLHVHEAGSGAVELKITNDTTNATGADGTAIGIDSSEKGFLWNYENTDLFFGTNNTTRMTIDNQGKVGIGVAAPDHLLEISHNDTSNITAGNIAGNSCAGIHISKTGDDDGQGSVIKFSSGSDGSHSAIAHIQDSLGDTDLAFYTDNGGTLTEAMRIDNSQKVGIGTDAPSNALHVEVADATGDGEFAAFIHNKDTDNGQGLMIRAGADSGEAILSLRDQANNEMAIFRGDGRVGIGVDPTARFTVAGPSINEDVCIIKCTDGASFTSVNIKSTVNKAAASNFWFYNAVSDAGGASEAVEMQLRGDGEFYAANASTNVIDYAEYFESTDGESISMGTTVVLDGGKVRASKSGETPFGVVSSTKGHGGAWNGWNKKFVKDDYGVFARDEDTCKIINPDWDEDMDYIPREERDGWNSIGLLGQIPITKGQPVASNWIKMNDISDSVEMWLVK